LTDAKKIGLRIVSITDIQSKKIKFSASITWYLSSNITDNEKCEEKLFLLLQNTEFYLKNPAFFLKNTANYWKILQNTTNYCKLLQDTANSAQYCKILKSTTKSRNIKKPD
jgi:hypothetical protein